MPLHTFWRGSRGGRMPFKLGGVPDPSVPSHSAAWARAVALNLLRFQPKPKQPRGCSSTLRRLLIRSPEEQPGGLEGQRPGHGCNDTLGLQLLHKSFQTPFLRLPEDNKAELLKVLKFSKHTVNIGGHFPSPQNTKTPPILLLSSLLPP